MKQFGLIGFPLSHSFSKKYFNEKFEKESIPNVSYENFQIASIEEFKALFDKSHLQGVNVTIPYKQQIIPFLDGLDSSAERIGAVNVVKKNKEGKLIGYNSDYVGFKNALSQFIPKNFSSKALILGTGGAAKAVEVALQDLQIPCVYVSRTAKENIISYEQLNTYDLNDYLLIINSTPLGMFPKVDEAPEIPYEKLTSQHFLYDLIYNPATTLFMQKGQEQGAHTMNGLSMLIGQAERAWEIWNNE
jgi:shikimate dehydrogenase